MPAAETPIWTVAALLQWTEQHFADKGMETPRLDAQVLLAHALGWKRPDLYIRYEYVPSEDERARYRSLVTKRAAGSPVAYLVGYKEFFLHRFEVSQSVLIPRPSTESLVLATLDFLQQIPTPTVLDLGTGSGCIAISIASRNKQAQITALDISEAALNCARRNADNIGVADRIKFVLGDLFDALPGKPTFDLIASNPPYIPTSDIANLDIGVREYEPHVAIDGGADGYRVVDRILKQAAAFLNVNGNLMLEVGITQAPIVVERAIAEHWRHVKTIKDADGIPRVVVLRTESAA